MKSATAHAIGFFRGLLNRFLQPRDKEIQRGTLYLEQARSERLTNVVRFCFVLVWTVTSAMCPVGDGRNLLLINLGVGVLWMSVTVLYHLWLAKYSACSLSKFYSTTVDMAIVALLMGLYAAFEGPAFVFKMPVFINFFFALGFAALRFDRNLVLYATLLAVGMLGGLWSWIHFAEGIEYGSLFEHASSVKLSAFYMTDILVYTAMFGFLTAMTVMNLRRQMDLRVAEAGRAAREEERALMAAGLAHEIRNPLGGIYGFAQLLREEGKGTGRYADAILEDARRLNGVVDEFLNFSRPFSVHPETVDLVSVVGAFCESESLRRGPKVIEYRPQPDHLWMQTDPAAVRQILLNLVQNAIRFQPEGVPIRVNVTGNAREAFVEVTDEGPGVAPEMLPRLFAPFQTSGSGGTGLGLSLSRRFARDLGGDLFHRAGKPGATFVLRLRSFSETRMPEGVLESEYRA